MEDQQPTQQSSLYAFIKKYAIFIAPALLLALFIFMIVFSLTASISKTENVNTTVAVPTTFVGNTSGSTQKTPTAAYIQNTKYEDEDEPINGMAKGETSDDLGWAPVQFSLQSLSDVKAAKTERTDGAFQYAYASKTPGRNEVIIVREGNIIFQRTPVYNYILSQTLGYYGSPQYTAKGSKFWGQDVIAYIYLENGYAVIGDPKTDKALEQMYFQPVSKSEFKKAYPTDIIGELE
jgi:hypothetical protein